LEEAEEDEEEEEEEEEEDEDEEEAGLPLSLLYVLYRRGGRSLTTNW